MVDHISYYYCIFSAYDDLPKKNQVNCSFEHPPEEGKVCGVDVQGFAPCTLENNFGYHVARPCIFLKLNKVSSKRVFNLNVIYKSLPSDLQLGTKTLQRF